MRTSPFAGVLASMSSNRMVSGPPSSRTTQAFTGGRLHQSKFRMSGASLAEKPQSHLRRCSSAWLEQRSFNSPPSEFDLEGRTSPEYEPASYVSPMSAYLLYELLYAGRDRRAGRRVRV